MTAPAGLIMGWPSTHASIPAGTVRLTDYDGIHLRGAGADNVAGINGGSSNHQHTSGHVHAIASHAHSGTTSSAGSTAAATQASGISFGIEDTHTHVITPGSTSGTTTDELLSSAALSLPTIAIIPVETDGTEFIPQGVVAWFSGRTAPTNWLIADGNSGTPNVNNRYWISPAASGNGGATSAGSLAHSHNQHTHESGDHDHPLTVAPAPVTFVATVSGSGATASSQGHTHFGGQSQESADTTGSGTSQGSTSPEPPFARLLPVYANTEIETVASGLVFGWRGLEDDIPAGYEICDGLEGRPDLRGRFLKGDITGTGALGGSETHTHTVPMHEHSLTHDHPLAGTLPASSGTRQHSAGAATPADDDHTHTFGATSGSNTQTVSSAAATDTGLGANVPPFRTVIWIIKIDDRAPQFVNRQYVPHRIQRGRTVPV